jgi:hypothetical protein
MLGVTLVYSRQQSEANGQTPAQATALPLQHDAVRPLPPSVRFEGRRNPLPLPGIETRLLECPAQSQSLYRLSCRVCSL